jgi:O-acetyl-ADP-ribose deacetylase (regulator of RNase III)
VGKQLYRLPTMSLHNRWASKKTLISCGIYGYPIANACKIAIVEVKKAIAKDSNIEKVIFACFSHESEKALKGGVSKK